MKETYEEFIKKLKNVSGPRKHRIVKSSGMAAAFTFYRNHRPQCDDYVLRRDQFDKIVNEMNLLMIERLLDEKKFILPCGLGKIMINKRIPRTFITDDDKLVCTKFVDYDATYRLWHEDEDAFNNKIIIRIDEDRIFRLKYTKCYTRISKNIKYFAFSFGRDLRKKLKNRILTDKTFDAYECK